MVFYGIKRIKIRYYATQFQDYARDQNDQDTWNPVKNVLSQQSLPLRLLQRHADDRNYTTLHDHLPGMWI